MIENHHILHCQQLIAGNLPFNYPGDALELKVGSGEMISLIGPRYSGKSQWLKTICGLEDQLSGEVYIHGVNTARLNADEWVMTRMKVAYIHENTALLSAANGLANVLAPALYHQFDKYQGKAMLVEQAMDILEEIDPVLNLDDLPAYIPREHQFKITLARALLLKPDVLVLDNPFTHFDIDTKREFQRYLKHKVKLGLSVIMRTSDIPFVLKNSDTIIFTEKENLHCFDSAQALLSSANPVIQEYMALQGVAV